MSHTVAFNGATSSALRTLDRPAANAALFLWLTSSFLRLGEPKHCMHALLAASKTELRMLIRRCAHATAVDARSQSPTQTVMACSMTVNWVYAKISVALLTRKTSVAANAPLPMRTCQFRLCHVAANLTGALRSESGSLSPV